MLSALTPVKNADASESRAIESSKVQPSAGVTIRLTTRAMACDFSVIMNPGPTEQIEAAGEVLEIVHAIEAWLSIYRESSDLSVVNRTAAAAPVSVRGDLFELLQLADDLHQRTEGAFDMSAGSLSQLWRSCRQQQRVPAPPEVSEALIRAGMSHVKLNSSSNSVQFTQPGIVLDPGAIGKGYALDQACECLVRTEKGPRSFLLHGGHSSLLARGEHNGHRGWPVGLGNPLFTEKRLGTILLCDSAMATSGSNIQFYRHEGRRFGHILDPRTGWPVEGMLSVTVLAPSAAVADALSTAFFVMGVEKARISCENWPGIGVILIPFPEQSRKVQPVVIGVPPDMIVWDLDQVSLE
jgi:thiamine biosynthesis lipoprotein